MNRLKIYSNDISASIVVFLVAIPLCLGIAMASGAPLIAGIIAGICGGIIVGAISNSQLGVSGPAAGLVAICITAISDLGGYENFLVAVMIAGLLQVIFGLLKGGKLSYFFPSSVITGMLVSIGIIIILKQLPHAFGYDKDYEGDMEFIQPDNENTFTEIINSWKYIHSASTFIFFIGLIIFWMYEKYINKHFKKLSNIIQAPLMIVISGIILTYIIQTYHFFNLTIEQEHLVNIPSIRHLFSEYKMPHFNYIFEPKLWYHALIISVIASVETLLCVEATDNLDPEKRITNRNRELIAQGIGNIFSGILGGLPVTQVIVRSSANINFGAKTKMSAILHGLWLLLSVFFLTNILNKIPLSSLATILIIVGYKLSSLSTFSKMYQRKWREFIPFIITIIATLLSDLLIGVLIGLVVAIVINYIIDSMSAVKVKINEYEYVVFINENASFMNKNRLNDILSSLSNKKIKVIYYGNDYDIIDIIEQKKNFYQRNNIIFEYINQSNKNQNYENT
ncbi:MAG: hypothetical protein OHK0036_03490 [Bacteroidia bacterium]